MKRPVVAIDGPAGAGKSTVTKRVAKELGYLLVDTGALYRAVALAALRAGVSWDDEAALGAFALRLVDERAVELATDSSGGVAVRLRGEDVSLEIREPSVSQGASKVSAVPAVREALLDMQRAAGARGGVVLEGRDIGTVVFPSAEAKFFLTASVDVRARRRMDELISRGTAAEFEDVRREVAERDLRDSTRPIAPLKQASDAISIDSSALSIDQVVARIVARVRAVEAELNARP
ncbi:MAG TPA: (d)CMP kinase [Polyangiaceae bacterium]|jgi:cytidylate kinase|nr:(d)CMP kinase [Polyangiaceae bacterium]